MEAGALVIQEAARYAALHFLRHNLHEDLKSEYLMEDDPLVLWNSLKESYNQQRFVLLPKAQREWTNLHFPDFKTVVAYNSDMHKLISKLRFYNQEVTEADMIEKILCTLHPNMRILQRQYHNAKYLKYSKLMHNLLEVGKHAELLMENHQIRLTGTMVALEAYANAQ